MEGEDISEVLAAPTDSFMTCLVAGGIAGTMVDVSLFPLDTIKTRLQTAEGFRASGGFKGVYRGLLATTAGSAPAGRYSSFGTAERREDMNTFSPREYWSLVNDIDSCNILRNLREVKSGSFLYKE